MNKIKKNIFKKNINIITIKKILGADLRSEANLYVNERSERGSERSERITM